MSDAPKRIFVPPEQLPDRSGKPPGRPFSLPEQAEHYARDVLRLERGNDIEILDGEGRIIQGRIQSIGQTGVKVAPLSDEKTTRAESPCDITLLQALPKGDRWRMVLEKGTELGVRRIKPIETERTVVQIPESRFDSKLRRWRRIVGNAARQCGRSHTPAVAPPSTVEQTLSETLQTHDTRLFLDADADESLREQLGATTQEPSVAIWIGPEGGFTDEERRALQKRGVEPVTFGPRILRTETAGISAITAAQLLCGDL